MNQGLTVLQMTVHPYRKLYQFNLIYLGVMLFCGLAFHPVPEGLAAWLTIPFCFVLLHALVAFVNPDADLLGSGSHYSPLLLRMPVRTSVLAAAPMVAGSVWAVVYWVVYAAIFFPNPDHPLPIVWPALALVSVVLCMQALMWTPIRYGIVRILLMVLIPSMAIIIAPLVGTNMVSAPILSAFFFLLSAIFGAFAWRGLERARTSSMTAIKATAIQPDVPVSTVREKPMKAPFRSALHAQVWMEWRQQGRLLPIVSTVTLLVLSLPLLWDQGSTSFISDSELMVRPWFVAVWPRLILVPVLFAAAIGMGARRPNMRNADGAYHLFGITRPISSRDMLLAKTLAFTIGTVVTWVVTLLVMFLWMFSQATIIHTQVLSNGNLGKEVVESGKVLSMIFGQVNRPTLIVSAVTLFYAVLLTWRNQWVGAFVDYLPKRWASFLYLFVSAVGGTILFMLVVMTRNWNEAPLQSAAIILSLLLPVKFFSAVWLAYRFVDLRATEARRVVAMFATWLGASVVLAIPLMLLGFYLESFAAGVPSYLGGTLEIVMFSLGLSSFYTPLARPLLARYAIESGRHG